MTKFSNNSENKYSVREIDNLNEWNAFVTSCQPHTFLQSWEWGQVQQATGDKARYLGIFNDGQQVGAALVVTVNARRGKHYLIPHGPIAASPAIAKNLVPELLKYLKNNKEKGICAIRLSPLLLSTEENLKYLHSLNMRPAPMHVHAELTWVLDISQAESDILSAMRKTTRHAIKKAEASAIKVSISGPTEALDRFWKLYGQTTKRHGFVPWPYEMLKAQARIFGAENKMFAVIASHQREDVSAALLIDFGKTVYYYHGASKKLPSSLPATQLVQWTAIKEAKRRGADKYNFWGIAPDDQPNHPFAGITTFKKGFGGEALDYMHAHDLPLSLGYYPMWGLEMWRKHRRGF